MEERPQPPDIGTEETTVLGPGVEGTPAIETRHEMFGDEAGFTTRTQKRLTYCHGCGKTFLTERMIFATCAGGGLLCFECAHNRHCKTCGHSCCLKHAGDWDEEQSILVCEACWEKERLDFWTGFIIVLALVVTGAIVVYLKFF